jgi:hypothetical protein
VREPSSAHGSANIWTDRFSRARVRELDRARLVLRAIDPATTLGTIALLTLAMSQRDQKALAKNPMNDKRNNLPNAYLSVSKKNKNTETKTPTSPEAGAPEGTKKSGKRQIGQRVTAAKKPRKTTATKATAAGAAHITASPPAERSRTAQLSEDVIRLRAYYISERRRRFALPGDAESDWLEAKRQLLAEARR